MRTKTLLIAVAALAVGVATAMAQTYSQNVVGYVNINLTNGVLACLSPALDLDGTGVNNTVNSVVGSNTNGLPLGTTVYVFNSGGGFDTLVYNKTGHPSVTNWYLGATQTNSYPINPGEGFFIVLGGSAPYTLTEAGTVLQGSLQNNYVPATAGSLWLVSSQIPIGGGITTTLNYQPKLQDEVLLYNQNTRAYDTYVYNKTGHPAVTNWYLGAVASEPQIQVGQGFWIQPHNAGTVWTNNFTVQ